MSNIFQETENNIPFTWDEFLDDDGDDDKFSEPMASFEDCSESPYLPLISDFGLDLPIGDKITNSPPLSIADSSIFKKSDYGNSLEEIINDFDDEETFQRLEFIYCSLHATIHHS